MARTLASARGIAVSRGLVGGSANVLASVPWVAQWKFNNDGLDSIGANHLTNNNSATFTTGKLGGATGATQLVAASSQSWTVASNSNLQTGNVSFLVAGWCYLGSKGVNRPIISKDDVGVQREYLLGYASASDRFRFALFDNASGSTVATANNLGVPATVTWYWVVGWFDSVANTAYINVNNGATDSTANSLTLTASTTALEIGKRIGAIEYFDGRLDNVLFAEGTGAVPSASVLSALYNGGAGTESITAIMEYQRAKRNLWRELGRLWEQQKRGWFNEGRARRVFA